MDSAAPPIRIALVAPRGFVPEPWQSRLIGRLMSDPRLCFTCRTGGESGPAPQQPSALGKGILALESRLLGRRKDTARDHDAIRAVASLPDAEDAEAAPFDLALSLTGRRLPARDLPRVRLGEVAVSFAGLPPGSSPFVASLSCLPEDGLLGIDILARTAALPEAHVVKRARYNTKPLARMTGDFLAEKALILLESHIHSLVFPQDGAHAPPRGRTQAEAPRSARRTTLRYCLKTLGTVSSRGLQRIGARTGHAASWQIGLASGGINDLSPATVTRLPRLHHTMADPFLFAWREGLYLFYEATRSDLSAGWIEAALIEDEGIVRLGPALKTQTHLSYPFVFSHDGEVYMMPETQQARRLEVWRATEFPLKWELHATALEGLYPADSSLFQHNGQWWLFTNLSDHSLYQDHSSELYLFAVDGPDLRRIEPHPMNPVVIGSDVARNAGAIIREGGRLFRPSQVNAHGIYGYGLNLMEIDRLDRHGYSERLYRRFTPDRAKGAASMHHLSLGAGRHVVDLFGQ